MIYIHMFQPTDTHDLRQEDHDLRNLRQEDHDLYNPVQEDHDPCDVCNLFPSGLSRGRKLKVQAKTVEGCIDLGPASTKGLIYTPTLNPVTLIPSAWEISRNKDALKTYRGP